MLMILPYHNSFQMGTRMYQLNNAMEISHTTTSTSPSQKKKTMQKKKHNSQEDETKLLVPNECPIPQVQTNNNSNRKMFHAIPKNNNE